MQPNNGNYITTINEHIIRNDNTKTTTTNNNIVHLHQRKCDGRISNPYEYAQGVYHQYHQCNDSQQQQKQSVPSLSWAPSRTRSIHPSSSASHTTITTHMDLFHMDNHHHHNTDQFLITINHKTPLFYNLYDGPSSLGNGGGGAHHNHNNNTIAIYNLWDDHSPQQHHPGRRQQEQPHRRRHRQQDDDENGENEEHLEFRPIQETLFTTTTTTSSASTTTTSRDRRAATEQNHRRSQHQNHILSGIQWYPIDTGTFITSTISNGGYVTLWDTNHMIPVLNCQPYVNVQSNHNHHHHNDIITSSATTVSTSSSTGIMYSRTPYGRTVRGRMTGRQSLAAAIASHSTSSSSNSSSSGICTMHIGTQQPYLVATGSHRSDMTKIVDLRSSSTSHTLMIGTHTSFIYDRDSTGSSSSSSRNNRSVTSVQWSPIQSNTLATCTNGNCYVWDIRSTVQPIAICRNKYPPGTNESGVVSSSCHSIDSYLSRHQKRSNKVQRKGLISNRTNAQQQQQELLRQQQQVAGHDIYQTLKFDFTGQYLITLSQELKQLNDTFITVFDLLSPGFSSDHEVPIYPTSRTLYSYKSSQDQTHEHATALSKPKSILFLTGQKPIEQKVWISASPSVSLCSYQMLQDRMNDDDDNENDSTCSADVLHGHMGRIRCCAVMTGPNRIRQRPRFANNSNNHTYAPVTIVTAAEDGVILIWEQQQQGNHKENKNTNTNEDHNKRQRLFTSQQLQQPSFGAGDYDTW